uniref:VWFA domain-containing protein n=1 Tax=Oryza barthii TaxID=65489 RepID=A0A0D3GCY8_9ORYZ
MAPPAAVHEGTACMAPAGLQGAGSRGNSSLEAAIVAEGSSAIQKLLVWVYNTHGRWPRIAEYNMNDLNSKVCELVRVMEHVGSIMSEAWSNGRPPIHKADMWIWRGIELRDSAMDVQSRFDELVRNNAPCLSICNTPQYLRKRCLLNFEASRITSFAENYASGSVERVSRPPKDDREFASLSKSSPQDHGCAFPAVCQFLDKPSTTVGQEPAVTGRTPVHAADSSGLAQQQEEAVAAAAGRVQLGVFTEVPAISSQRREKFAVMVRVKAPAYTKQTRAPLDLVMVLDIGGRMRDELEQLKQGAKFIIHNLTQQDRLSIVTFGPRADRLSELTPMTEQGKRSSNEAVQALEASGGVKIGAGLNVAYEVRYVHLVFFSIEGIFYLASTSNPIYAAFLD